MREENTHERTRSPLCKHGSTRGIAERIAGKVEQLGKEAEARPVDEVAGPLSYEAFVIGSAVYYGSWLKEATE